MTKHYCDRCKSEIEGESIEVHVCYYATSEREYELCEKCSREVEKWLRGDDIVLEDKIKAQAQEMLIKNFNKWGRE